MNTPVTPCRGKGPLYDIASHPHTPPEERYPAQLAASVLCSRCPIAKACPDHVNPPTLRSHYMHRKDSTVTVTDITPQKQPETVPTSVDELLAWGAAHQSSRIQTLAGKARGALADLRQAAERETKVADAEARIKRLKAQLANAEQDLRAAKTPAKTPAGKQASTGDKPAREELAAIRAWARENGYQVGTAGVVKREIVDAYRAAKDAA